MPSFAQRLVVPPLRHLLIFYLRYLEDGRAVELELPLCLPVPPPSGPTDTGRKLLQYSTALASYAALPERRT
jgi:hypothetical protein